MADKHAPVMIAVNGVSKSFRLPHEKTTSIKSAVVNFWRQKRSYELQKVLKDVNFEIKQGEFFGIVGRNGSGKSTLLKLLAGIYSPSKGSIQVHGRLTPFIELGVGFNPELTGRENVFLNGALLGFSRKEMDRLYNDIVSFAELERFMDQKLKNYSSGMQVRLAFSIAIRAQSDILLIDEVLAVGDAAFQTKCFDYFYELKKKGATVVFVSHDRSSLERFCDRGILVDKGEITKAGTIQEVLQEYSKVVLEELGNAEAKKNEDTARKPVVSEYAAIQNTTACDAEGRSKKKFSYGDPIGLRFTVQIKHALNNPVFGITVWQKNLDKAVFATNTLIDGVKETGAFAAGETVEVTIDLPKFLNDGEYYIEPAIANESASVFLDQRPRAATFLISGSDNPHSLLSSDQKLKLTVRKAGKK
ncbi:MAG TPA: ABC transporter ATP-binding protein [Candidatus Saccharimonadales bacterium]|nr:ABC transporter ATP-binding protein [Candidatus Saccharimonadales bacterium]